MPLYSCPRCGWATAASWRSAVRAHDVGCPECPGAVELVPMAGRERDNIACVDTSIRPFEIHESNDPDGALRVVLFGGLDIVVADRLAARLNALLAARRFARVDVSGLGFVDCTGLRVIVDAVARARRSGVRFEVDRPVSAPVKRVITYLDAASQLWPSEPRLRVIDGSREDGPADSGRPRVAGYADWGVVTAVSRRR